LGFLCVGKTFGVISYPGNGVIYNGQTKKGNWYQDFQTRGQDRCAYYVISFVILDGDKLKRDSPFQQSIRDMLNSDGNLGERMVAVDISRGAYY